MTTAELHRRVTDDFDAQAAPPSTSLARPVSASVERMAGRVCPLPGVGFEVRLDHWDTDRSYLKPVALEPAETLVAARGRLADLAAAFDSIRRRLLNGGPPAQAATAAPDAHLRAAGRIPGFVDLYCLTARAAVGLAARCANRMVIAALEATPPPDSRRLEIAKVALKDVFNVAGGVTVDTQTFAAVPADLENAGEGAPHDETEAALDATVEARDAAFYASHYVATGNPEWLFDLLQKVTLALRYGTCSYRALLGAGTSPLIRAAAEDYLLLMNPQFGAAEDVGPPLDCRVTPPASAAQASG